MKKYFFTLLLLLTGFSLFSGETPRQFRVWGKKARRCLGAVDPIRSQHGIKSIRIPKDLKRTSLENKSMPEIPSNFKAKGFVVFSRHYMTMTYPETIPDIEEIGKQLRSIATPGEFVTMTFSVRSLKRLNCLEVNVPSLSNKSLGSNISSSNIDLRIVRYLPQKIQQSPKYILAPKYLESFDEFDILNMPPNQTERFWLTIFIPPGTTPGVYEGKIKIGTRDVSPYRLRFAIKVLPFKLAVPDPYTEMNFSILSNDNDPRFSRWAKDVYPQDMHRNFADMVEHGMNSTIYQHVNPHVNLTSNGKLTVDFDKPGFSSYYSFNNFMHIYKKAGFTGPYGYYDGPYEWSAYMVPAKCKVEKYTKEYNKYIQELFIALEKHRKKQKWPEFIYFLGDEPGSSASRIKLNMNLGKQLKIALPGAKSSNFFNGEWFGAKDWLILKDVTTINCTNFVTKKLIDESKAAGYESLWVYNGCAKYPTDYRGYRIFYGFHPWKINAKGVTQYKYQDFNQSPTEGYTAYDQINSKGNFYDFAYPSPSGPLPTPKWECVRQGIYDYRYLMTLSKYIQKVRAIGKNNIADKAGKVLNEVMGNFPYNFQSQERVKVMENLNPLSLDIYRWKIAKEITILANQLSKQD